MNEVCDQTTRTTYFQNICQLTSVCSDKLNKRWAFHDFNSSSLAITYTQSQCCQFATQSTQDFCCEHDFAKALCPKTCQQIECPKPCQKCEQSTSVSTTTESTTTTDDDGHTTDVTTTEGQTESTTTTEGQTESTTTTEGQTEFTTTAEGQTEFTTTTEGQTESTTEDSPDINTEDSVKSTTEDDSDATVEDRAVSTSNKDAMYRRFPDKSDMTSLKRRPSQLMAGKRMRNRMPLQSILIRHLRSAEPSMVDLKQRSSQSTTEPPMQDKSSNSNRRANKSDMASLKRRPSQLMAGKRMRNRMPLQSILIRHLRGAEPSLVDLKQRSSKSTTEPPMQDKSSNSNRRANKSDMASLKRRLSQLMAGKRMRNRMPLQSILIRYLRSAEPSMVDLKQRASESTTKSPIEDGIDLSPGSNTDVGALDPATKAEMDYPEHLNV